MIGVADRRVQLGQVVAVGSMTPAADTIQARKTSASMMAPLLTMGIAEPSVPTAGRACLLARPRAG